MLESLLFILTMRMSTAFMFRLCGDIFRLTSDTAVGQVGTRGVEEGVDSWKNVVEPSGG